jgi:hypothetical protein
LGPIWEHHSDAYDPDEVRAPDAALTLDDHGRLNARLIREGSAPPSRPAEYAAQMHEKTCPGVPGVVVPDVLADVTPLRQR